FTPIRVVCQNTLNAAEKTAQRQGVVIRHTGNLATKMDEARRVLGLADAYYSHLQEQVDAMARQKLNRAQVLSYFQVVYPAPAEPPRKRAKAKPSRNCAPPQRRPIGGPRGPLSPPPHDAGEPTMSTSTTRDDILARIQALMAKTTDRGASEAEAQTAMAMAAK